MKISLNLVPQYKKEEIKKSETLRKVLKWEVKISVVLIIFLLILLSVNYILKVNLSLIANSFIFNENNPRYAEMEKYNSGIKEINSRISDMENIQKGQIYWSKIFFKLNNLVSSDVVLSNYSNKEFQIFLVGKAANRDKLVAFKEKLEQEECFSEVGLPLSNLVSKENVDFQIEFKIKDECVKNQ